MMNIILSCRISVRTEQHRHSRKQKVIKKQYITFNKKSTKKYDTSIQSIVITKQYTSK